MPAAERNTHPVAARQKFWQLSNYMQYCWPTTGIVEQLGCVWEFRIQKLANIHRLVRSLVAIVQSWYLQSTQMLLITLVCQ